MQSTLEFWAAIFGLIAAIAGAAAAVFAYINTRSTRFERTSSFDWYNSHWKAMLSGSIMDLPIRLAELIDRARRAIKQRVLESRRGFKGGFIGACDRAGLYSGAIVGPGVVFAVNGEIAALACGLLAAPYALAVFIDHLIYGSLHSMLTSRLGGWLHAMNMIGMTWIALAILRLPSIFSPGESLIALSILSLAIWSIAARWFDVFSPRYREGKRKLHKVWSIQRQNKDQRGLWSVSYIDESTRVNILNGYSPTEWNFIRPEAFFGQDFLALTTTFSFLLTLGAAVAGHAICFSCQYLLSVQMFVVNAVCDTLTVTTAIFLFNAAILRRVSFFEAVSANLILAAVFSFLALWLGAMGSTPSFSVAQAWRVGWGLDPTEARLYFGPYFWIMHTTFIPMLFYSSLLAIALFQRAMLIAIAYGFRRDPWEKPHEVTAQLLGGSAALLALFAALLGFASMVTK